MSIERVNHRRDRGFTLMEVMIALIIFALLAVIVQQTSAAYVGSYTRLEGQTMATWIAQNRLAEMRLEGAMPAVSEFTEELEFGPYTWELDIVVSDTQDPAMRRVDVTVGRFDDGYSDSRRQLVFTGYLGEH